MNINLSLSAAPGIISNKLVVAVYNTTAPATVVSSQSFNPPHSAPRNISFTGLNPGVYIVKTYESTDGTPSGVVRHQFIYDPTYGSAQVRVDAILIVGTTPGLVAGTTSYVDTTFAGWEYSIERRGFGSMIDSNKSTTDADYTPINTGGFNLIATGDVFGDGEIFIVHFLPIITNAAPTISQTAGVIWSGVKDITTDTTLVAADMGKYCIIEGVGATLDILLPASDSVVDGTLIAFLSDGGSHLAANIKPAGTDQIKWAKDTWNNADPFSICQGEEIWLAYHGNAWRVMMADGAWKSVGEMLYAMSLLGINTLQADGNLYSRAQYPRLWRYINTKLDASLLVTDSTWNFMQTSTVNGTPYHFYPNVCKFSSGDGVSTFRMPLLFKTLDSNGNLKSGGYLRAVSGAGGELAGAQNIDAVGNFVFDSSLPQGDSFNGHPYNPTALGKGLSINAPFNLPFTFYAIGKNPLTNLANGETRPFSTNVYCLIRY